VSADLTNADWEETLDRQLRGRSVYGLVHAAWPGAHQGSLLDVKPGVVAGQLEFGSLVTIRLARFLKSRAGDTGRLIVIGTTAATLKPVVNLSAYSLGKAALEHTVRLLAPELARKNITANVVAPSFVPTGMNAAKANKVILSETAKVPLGRLCLPEDVTRTVEHLLSPGASFLTGQLLPLTGGQL
jgi:3-oxoacyl-[acyl-carrier protein] reductase